MLPNLFSHNMLKITYYDINIFSLLKTKKYTYKYLKNKKILTEQHFSMKPEAYHYVWFLRSWSHFFSHYVEGLFSRAEMGLIVTSQNITQYRWHAKFIYQDLENHIEFSSLNLCHPQCTTLTGLQKLSQLSKIQVWKNTFK